MFLIGSKVTISARGKWIGCSADVVSESIYPHSVWIRIDGIPKSTKYCIRDLRPEIDDKAASVSHHAVTPRLSNRSGGSRQKRISIDSKSTKCADRRCTGRCNSRSESTLGLEDCGFDEDDLTLLSGFRGPNASKRKSRILCEEQDQILFSSIKRTRNSML